jgi:polyamine oxidase
MFDPEQGGFSDSDNNLLSFNQCGFEHTFLKPEQILLNATVCTIGHSGDSIIVMLANGTHISTNHTFSTFSLGVLQNDDIMFEPVLPMCKQEAI